MFSRSGQKQVLSQPSSRLRSGVLAALFAVGLLAAVPVAASASTLSLALNKTDASPAVGDATVTASGTNDTSDAYLSIYRYDDGRSACPAEPDGGGVRVGGYQPPAGSFSFTANVTTADGPRPHDGGVSLVCGYLQRPFSPSLAAQAGPITFHAPGDVPDGGQVSSGTTVSPSDPVQLIITAEKGGTINIVKSTAARPAPGGGPEEDADASKPSWVGPRFEVSGDATIAKVEVLVYPDAIPPSGFVNPDGGRLAAMRYHCSCFVPGALASVSALGQAADGTIRGELDENFSSFRQSDGFVFDFAKLGFTLGSRAGVKPPTIGERSGYKLDALLRGEDFYGYFACSLRCTVTPEITVSRRVQRALGLKSR
jgi:hypothetical protein